MNIGQSKIAAAVTGGQLFEVEAHQEQHRGVKVVNVHSFLDGGEAGRNTKVPGTDREAPDVQESRSAVSMSG